MRYVISTATSTGIVAHQRDELANALWIAMYSLDQPGSRSVKIRDTITGAEIEGEAIRDLAAKTPGWQNSSFDAPDR